MKYLKHVLGVALLSLSLSTSLAADAFPWPWGVECPFPWASIEGYWEVSKSAPGEIKKLHSYLEFKVIAELEDGRRYFEIRQFDLNHHFVAEGRASAPRGQKIVRAVMLTRNENDQPQKSYMAVIRAYDQKYLETQQSQCLQDDLVRVVTFWDVETLEGEEVHMYLKKVKPPETL